MLEEQVAQLPDQPPAVGGREPSPGARFKRLPGCPHRPIDILLVPLRHLGDHLAPRRVVGWERLAGGRLNPFSVDQHALGLLGECAHLVLNAVAGIDSHSGFLLLVPIWWETNMFRDDPLNPAAPPPFNLVYRNKTIRSTTDRVHQWLG